jgi:hypothetical protein
VVGYNIGSRGEVPGEWKPVIRDGDGGGGSSSSISRKSVNIMITNQLKMGVSQLPKSHVH